jgi:DNA mismatch repair protein MutS2
VAVFAEQKRTVKGILHGESESRRTTFIEPEETIELNNDIYSLESDEKREVYRLLRELTSKLSVYSSLLSTYHSISVSMILFVQRQSLPMDVNGEFPLVEDKAIVHLEKAFHPLLYLYNKKANKPTIPVSLTLDEKTGYSL